MSPTSFWHQLLYHSYIIFHSIVSGRFKGGGNPRCMSPYFCRNMTPECMGAQTPLLLKKVISPHWRFLDLHAPDQFHKFKFNKSILWHKHKTNIGKQAWGGIDIQGRSQNLHFFFFLVMWFKWGSSGVLMGIFRGFPVIKITVVRQVRMSPASFTV